MSHATSCPIDQLSAFVQDSLDDSLHQSLIEHLDQCESCRRRIEDEAGPEDDWAIASEALSDSDLSQSSLRDTLDVSSQAGSTPDPLAIMSLLAPSDHPRAAGRIGPFEVTGIVGSGGMGIVLKARDPALDRYVAIKMLAPHLASSASARKRFAREARAAAAVIHDNVIAIYQVAHWQDLPYLVMPYLPDPSLEQRIQESSGLDLQSTLSVGLQIARGLSAAHAQGLVHRDVKPANVLLCKGTERAVITDFGLARASDDASLTRAGALAGTPHYMSPEQARGESVDQRSDLFSLGSVIFSMIAGHPPIESTLGSETIGRIADADLPSLQAIRPETPPWLIYLVDWLHAEKPADRPRSAEQVAGLLEQCLAHVRQPTKTPLPDSLLPTGRLRRTWVTVAITFILLAGLAVGSMLVDPATPKPVEKSPNSGQPQVPRDASLGWSDIDTEISQLQTDTEAFESDLSILWQIRPDSKDGALTTTPETREDP